MNKYIFLFITALVINPGIVKAQGIDAGRAALIELTSNSAKKTIESQEKMQGLMTTGHIWTQQEVQAVNDFRREFNEYLDNFHDVLSMAAEIFGLYYEVERTGKNIKNLEKVLADCPTNALAVAFSTHRNKVYTNIAKTGTDIIMDIRKVCFDEKAKLTEKEKLKIVGAIRPKLRTLNKQLSQLVLALRYTSFTTVWNELIRRAERINPERKKDIVKQAMQEWRDNASDVSAKAKK